MLLLGFLAYQAWVFFLLRDDNAKSFTQQENSGLYLDQYRWMTDGAAKALSKFQGNVLWLKGLTSFSPEAAQTLSQCRGTLRLHLNNLPPSAAKILQMGGR